MSNYTKLVNYSVKDVLPTGNVNKIIRGIELDAEFAAIAQNMATKGEANNGTFTNTTFTGATFNGTSTINGTTTVNGSMTFTTSGGGSFNFDAATFNNIFVNNGFIDNVQFGTTTKCSGFFSSINADLIQTSNIVITAGTVVGTFTVPTPVNATDVVNKSYVDTAVNSLSSATVAVYTTYAAALAGAAGLPDGRLVQVLVDETLNNGNSFYSVLSGGLVFVSTSDFYSSPSAVVASDTMQNMVTKLLVKTNVIPGITGVVESDFSNLSY